MHLRIAITHQLVISTLLVNFERHCPFNRSSRECAYGSILCQNAMAAIQGTILTTNCTCEGLPGADHPLCLRAQSRLQQDYSLCTSRSPVVCQSSTLIATPSQRKPSTISTRLLRQDCGRTSFGMMNLARLIQHTQVCLASAQIQRMMHGCFTECRRQLGVQFPLHFTHPEYTRVSENQ
jgi:hypothetical protein